jgi:hypothetical protein
MDWVGALQYGTTGLAAVLGFFVAGKIRSDFKDRSPSEADQRMLNRYMLFCLALLVLSGGFGLYDNYFIQESKRLGQIREQVNRIDIDLINKLDFESSELACLPPRVKHSLEPIIYRMCFAVKQVAESAGARIPGCKTEPSTAPGPAPICPR